jgi:hypothetical protein
MRARSARLLQSIAAAFAAAIVVGTPAAAHEGAPPIALEPGRASPGAAVTVRLEDRSSDETLRVFLVGTTGRADLGSVVTDGEGHATLVIPLPTDLQSGPYAIDVVDALDSHIAASLIVEGTPIAPAELEPGGRDEEDNLLAPLPPGWQRSLGGPIVTAVPVAAGASSYQPTASGGVGDSMLLVAVAGVVIGVVVLAGFGLVRSRPAGGTDRGRMQAPPGT